MCRLIQHLTIFVEPDGRAWYPAILAVYPDISPQCIGIIHHSSEAIRRAANTAPTPIQNVSVDHRYADVFVTQKFLNCANIVPSSNKLVAKDWRNVWQLTLEVYVPFSRKNFKTNKQMNELWKLIQRAREIEHQLIKSQKQIWPPI